VCGRLTAALTVAAVLGSTPSACERFGAPDSTHVDALRPLTAEAGMRIGDRDDPNLGFSRITGVDVGRDGRIYAMEAMVPEIRVFSPDGVLLHRIGRRGSGPGEFEGPPRFGVVGDTVWAFSFGDDRITLFDAEGTTLSARRAESIRVPLPQGWGWVVPWTMLPDGRFTGHFARVGGSRNDPPTGVQPGDRIPWPFVLFEPTGAVSDTIGWAPRPPPRMWRPPSEADSPYEFVEIAGRRMMVPRPPTTMPWWEPLPDGYLLVEAKRAETPEDGVFTVTRFGLAGDTVFSRAFHYRPNRYAPAELDSIAARAARGEAGGMVPFSPTGGAAPPDWRTTANNLRAAMTFPEFKVPILATWPARDGSLWLRLADGDETIARWLLLDDRGRPRGVLELPSTTRILWNSDDVFWAAEPDELDVPWLVRFTVRPG
jgi:hypothetical protein